MSEAGVRRTKLLISAIVILAFVAGHIAFDLNKEVSWSRYNLMRDYELKLYDLRLRALPKRDDPSGVVIVAIDEQSLRQVGRWPWPRWVLADLVDNILSAGPAAVGLDLVLSEPERTWLQQHRPALREWERDYPAAAEALEQHLQQVSGDARLTRTMREADKVVLAAFLTMDSRKGPGSGTPETLPSGLERSEFGAVHLLEHLPYFPPPHADAATLPLDRFAEVAAGVGFVNVVPDPDGTVRRVPACFLWQDRFIASFDVTLFRVANGQSSAWTQLWIGEMVGLGGRRVPLSENCELLLPFRTPPARVPTSSAMDVLSGRVPRRELSNKIIVVGATAPGLYDLRVTSVSQVIPGVFINAEAIETLRHGDAIRHDSAMALVFDLVVMVLWGSLMAVVFIRLTPLHATLATMISVLGYALCLQWVMQTRHVYLHLTYPVSQTIAVALALGLYGYFTEGRSRNQLRRMFASYVSPKIVEQLVARPELASLHGARRDMTVMFADVVGFSSFSENRDPEEIVGVLNELFDTLTDAVLEFDGTLDKFVGDEIMAFWGAPTPQPDHADLAVQCAVNMLQRLENLQERWRYQGHPVLHIGVGINSGEMVVGNMGAEGRKMDYTVIGDNVNVAARIVALTRTYERSLIISESTLNRLRHSVEHEPLGETQVKGRREPVALYAIRVEPRASGNFHSEKDAGKGSLPEQVMSDES